MSRFSFRKAPVSAPATAAPETPAPAPESAAAPVVSAPAPAAPRLIVEEPPPPAASTSDPMLDMRIRIHGRLIEEIDLSKLDKLDEGEMRRQVRKLVGETAKSERLALNSAELDKLGDEVFDEMVGLGPIEPLLGDDAIADILINGPFQVFVERRGELVQYVLIKPARKAE